MLSVRTRAYVYAVPRHFLRAELLRRTNITHVR